MITIGLTGSISSEIESATDKRGTPYVKFKMICKNNINDDEEIFRIMTYDPKAKDLKPKNTVALYGTMSVKRINAGSETWINLDVWAKTLEIL